MRIGDEHQVDIVVVEHVLGRYEAVVRANEVVHREQHEIHTLEHQANVEHLSAASIVLGTICFAHLLCRSVQLPMDRLERVEQEA